MANHIPHTRKVEMLLNFTSRARKKSAFKVSSEPLETRNRAGEKFRMHKVKCEIQLGCGGKNFILRDKINLHIACLDLPRFLSIMLFNPLVGKRVGKGLVFDADSPVLAGMLRAVAAPPPVLLFDISVLLRE